MEYTSAEITQIMILIVLIVQAFLIYKALRADHERRKKQATFEFVNAVSDRYKNAIQGFNTNHGIGKVVDINDYTDDDTYFVKSYLSEMERICAGVNCDVFDYDILKRMMAGTMITNHMRFSQYIKKAQERRPTFYCEFDAVVSRLKDDERPSSKKGKIKRS